MAIRTFAALYCLLSPSGFDFRYDGAQPALLALVFLHIDDGGKGIGPGVGHFEHHGPLHGLRPFDAVTDSKATRSQPIPRLAIMVCLSVW